MEEDRDDDDTFGEDEDVIAERARVEAGQYANDSPIVIANLKKQYPNGKLAVKSVSLAIEVLLIFSSFFQKKKFYFNRLFLIIFFFSQIQFLDSLDQMALVKLL